jgi:hypothetical protein
MGGETNVLLQVAHMSVSETNYRDALARGVDEQNKRKTKLRIQLIKVLIMLIQVLIMLTNVLIMLIQVLIMLTKCLLC